MSVYDVLKERGFLKQLSHEDEIKELLEKEKITFYIGFDPTADSLHVGHFIALMVMSHMQRAGHRPICLLGGGTGMVGDPSGKDDMRKVISIADRKEAIRTACMLAQAKDVVLVAGKGHENYQEIKGVKHHFDDKEVLKDIFANE